MMQLEWKQNLVKETKQSENHLKVCSMQFLTTKKRMMSIDLVIFKTVRFRPQFQRGNSGFPIPGRTPVSSQRSLGLCKGSKSIFHCKIPPITSPALYPIEWSVAAASYVEYPWLHMRTIFLSCLICRFLHSPSISSRHSSTVRGMWNDPQTTPSRTRCSLFLTSIS